jgi:hypothetical protein
MAILVEALFTQTVHSAPQSALPIMEVLFLLLCQIVPRISADDGCESVFCQADHEKRWRNRFVRVDRRRTTATISRVERQSASEMEMKH